MMTKIILSLLCVNLAFATVDPRHHAIVREKYQHKGNDVEYIKADVPQSSALSPPNAY